MAFFKLSFNLLMSASRRGRVLMIRLKQEIQLEAASATPAEGGGVVQPPSAETLKTLFISSAVPMIGFGFMDNMVMIQAGDLIDNTIGVKFGLATLTAAACGQVFSDVSGVCFGGVVDAMCAKLGLPTADLSTAQRQLPIVKRTATGGSVVGVVVGCCLGMLSLLFMDLEAAERAKKQQELDTIFKTVIREGSETLNAERCSLFVVDPDTREVWTRAATGVKAIIKVGLDDSLVGFAVKEKKILNVKNAYEHPKFNKTHDVETGFRTQSILCVPVFGEAAGGGAEDQDQDPSQNKKGLGEVVAVVQVVNRMRENRKEIDVNGFDEQDERAARMLARHVGIFLAQVGGD
eukprot:g16360.t1